jgi:hypothetical protein
LLTGVNIRAGATKTSPAQGTDSGFPNEHRHSSSFVVFHHHFRVRDDEKRRGLPPEAEADIGFPRHSRARRAPAKSLPASRRSTSTA